MPEETKWFYYNHAYLPDTQPDEVVDVSEVTSGNLWKRGHKGTILARWTTDFDCGYETAWWYIIKDAPFDIDGLKSKRRYRINQGLRNFHVRPINPEGYINELFRVQCEAYNSYPKKYRPNHTLTEMEESARRWNKQPDCLVFGAFYNETDQLSGYAIVIKKARCLDFDVLKVDPDYEKYSINHALIATILKHYDDLLKSGCYICNGERNVQHETNFQEFIEKYFGYRRAYCHLNIKYNPQYRWLIKILYLFRKSLTKLDGIRVIHKINGVLKMEEIVRSQEKKGNYE